MLLAGALIMGGLAVGFHPGRRIRRSGDRCLYRARGRMVMLIVGVLVVSMFMLMIVMIMMFRAAVVMSAVVGVGVQIFGVQLFRVQAFGAFRAFMRPGGLRRIGACVLDDLALHALAIAAAARVAVARPAAVGAVFALLLGLAMGAFVCFDQRLAIGDRDLIIVRMDFAEGEKAVAVATVLDEGRLQRRLYPRDLGEIDVAAQLF